MFAKPPPPPDSAARMEFAAQLSAYVERIERGLDALVPPADTRPARLHEAMRYSLQAGGKRLRPVLVLAAADLFGRRHNALPAAIALECVHTYSLVHDDLPCMDDDDLRRGQPTTHIQFDEATALLAGDALLTFAFEILSDPATHPDPQMRCLLISGLAKASGPTGMCAGQMIDMRGESLSREDIAAITRMNRLKTGALISYSVEAGALIGAASEDARTALSRFATDVGLAFQMVDDLLDVEGAEDEVGKRTAKDADAGKVNFVTILGVEGAQARVRLLAAQAKQHLAIFGPRAKVLCEAVDFVLDRRY